MEMQYTKMIDLGFSVADAEPATVRYDDDRLFVTFVDWQAKVVDLVCSDVVAFRWQHHLPLAPPVSQC
jgi:hypothetical protein